MVARIPGEESIFRSRDRIAMPDEVLYFGTGNDRDRALLLFTLLRQPRFGDHARSVAFASDKSFVLIDKDWIDAMTFTKSKSIPKDALVFGSE